MTSRRLVTLDLEKAVFRDLEVLEQSGFCYPPAEKFAEQALAKEGDQKLESAPSQVEVEEAWVLTELGY